MLAPSLFLYLFFFFSPPSCLGNICHRGGHWQITWPDVTQRIIDFEILWFCAATGQMFLLVVTVISGSKCEHWVSWSQLLKELWYHLIRWSCESLLCLYSPKRWKSNFLDIQSCLIEQIPVIVHLLCISFPIKAGKTVTHLSFRFGDILNCI